MKLQSKVKGKKVVSSVLALSLLTTPFMSTSISAAKPSGGKVTSQVELRIMETTDIHTNLLSYDYYKNAEAPKLGLAKTATLVKQARKEVKNSVLVDNGDLIQGNPLGTYKAKVDPLEDGEVHPAIKAMNLMDYDIVTLGNHEFNYGLDYLDEVYDDANFPVVNANVYIDDLDQDQTNDVNKYSPYKIVNKKVTDNEGKTKVIKIGYIGFVPPQINEWDKAHLDGKVITKNIVETAEKFVPMMEEEGADVIIALAHSGFNGNEAHTEDAVYALSKVAGIDAITFSHTHKTFPAKSVDKLDRLFKGPDGNPLPGVDNEKGTINGVAAVQAGYGGGSLGIIDLSLQKVRGKWSVATSQSSTREIEHVQPDSAIVEAVTADHEATIEYVNTPIGTTTDDIHSYFALVQDDPSVQIVTNAQKWYVEKYVELNKPEYRDLPILSVGAPFKAGRNGVEEYTEIKKGDLTIRSAGDLYLYDNTLKAVKVKGSVVKEWIEMSAGKFNTIDPTITEAQELLSTSFPVYNFDVIDGVTYQIDVTQPAKYGKDGSLINPDASRVVNLEYNGEAIDLEQDFIVVTNNYRAGGGGNFPGIKGSELVVDSADENRQILMDYISEMKEVTPTADNNWSIAPISADVKVTFTTSPNAEKYIDATSPFSYTGQLDQNGFGIFEIDLNRGIKVQLLGLNDLHGQLDTSKKIGNQLAGKVEYTAAALKAEEATNPNTLLVHSGDMIGGSPLVSALFQDEPTIEVLEAMGVDVGALGNHEFDEGIDELKRMMHGGNHPNGNPGYDGMNFPLVAANAYDTRDGQLITEPYTVFTIGGQKVGFIGVVTQETPTMIVRKGNETLQITDEVEAINKYTAELKSQGIQSIVVLAHNPASQTGYTDKFDLSKIAEQISDEVDVLFAAHNHVEVNRLVDNKLIVQAFSYGTAFSDVDLEIDPFTGDIYSKSAEIKTVFQNNYTPDPEVAAIMEKYAAKVEPIKAQVVGGSVTTLAKGYPTTASEFGDFGLGNLIADGMKYAMNADFALMNGGGVRSPLDAGEVTYGDLFAVQPFGNTLNKVNLSGADLRIILDEQITAKGLDYHIAGFKYTYTYDFETKTGKVVDILLPDGSKIDETKEYTVVVNNYMYGNADTSFEELSTNLEVGPVDVDATVEYVKTLSNPFEYQAEGRIQLVVPALVQ
ncbi:2',3'-cyclic-nucleotide 2'-phosphodiesterase/3'-nucleotidase/5'-nucleotidase [Bacillus mesophilus]|uniref:Bifunctional 2',3'-cyclic-nucleotide 2'-phosphodiesterase/3'-nucleotidase n=1 Tax=Bacillus mesophilus TaxID=1808955 RepID=A0A6M0Q9N9_9BACI|nr:bifunctional 2',3'-cyclic-nucleotide 2'-phosphodiesterase/3'-nucleotidase [Bacillus mesophilus]MBM7662345.1 2',3'-cyclic-nucleotide 2'-phosphodiesterase/3'-nucleotidase/5'-nucleotidase [Bacillus mesophilus]NEY73025.1 bifunctional 2',3'-cyclic-nucleotide 2'-phosphodiesterase/3'-nucleotidase [Bacillus mesophilus]